MESGKINSLSVSEKVDVNGVFLLEKRKKKRNGLLIF